LTRRDAADADEGVGGRALPRVVTYAVAGLVLSAGAPAGLLLARVAAGLARPSALAAEWAAQRLTYVYLAVSTCLAFTGFGAVLGRQTDRLLRLAIEDGLTGLLNRRGVTDRLQQELARAQRHRWPLSVLLLDVDRLKDINDRGGHRAGDRALREIGQAIRGACRTTDAAGRWGGDEFLVVAPSSGAEAARTLAERIRAGARVAATVSIGVASQGPAEPVLEIGDLLSRADTALYRAKSAGRDRVEVFGS
jgi:diguanylate cyclase (GGDEF)-like protein